MLFSRCFHMKITTFLKKLIIHNAKKFNPNNQIRHSNLRPTMHLKEYHHMTSFNNILAYFFKHVFHFAYKNKCNGHFQFSAVCYKNRAHSNNTRGKGHLVGLIFCSMLQKLSTSRQKIQQYTWQRSPYENNPHYQNLRPIFNYTLKSTSHLWFCI